MWPRAPGKKWSPWLRTRKRGSNVPDRFLHPHPMPHSGNERRWCHQEVTCQCTLQGFKDPNVSGSCEGSQDGDHHVLTEMSSDDLAVDCFVPFCADNRRRDICILAGRQRSEAEWTSLSCTRPTLRREKSTAWEISPGLGGRVLVKNSSSQNRVSTNIPCIRVSSCGETPRVSGTRCTTISW